MLALVLHAPALIGLGGGCVTFAAALGGIAASSAYKSAAQGAKSAAEGWREERDAAVSKAGRLEAQVETLSKKVDALQQEVDSLRSKDTSKLFDLMVTHQRETSEEHAQLIGVGNALAARIDALVTATDRARS